jgi:hypothetical protein
MLCAVVTTNTTEHMPVMEDTAATVVTKRWRYQRLGLRPPSLPLVFVAG